jgi:hypothetical protein
VRTARIAGVALVVAGALAALGWGSRAPYASAASSDGLLRLSWRMRSESAQVCRARTPEELASLPAHMRTPEVCVTQDAVYRLELDVDDDEALVLRMHPHGARGDRPLFVFHERRLVPGEHDVRVRFHREHDGDEEDEDEDDEDDQEDALEWSASVVARRGDILLVTLDETERRLILKTAQRP